ncbi:hypothetical protein WN48_10202 [Eufriesea mexicana]|nr:hypothetical protein WN48_10202 [Eufriesea mexicana]
MKFVISEWYSNRRVNAANGNMEYRSSGNSRHADLRTRKFNATVQNANDIYILPIHFEARERIIFQACIAPFM